MLSDQCTSNPLSDVSHTESIVEDFHNLNYATQDDSSMLAACGHSFNSEPSSDYNFSPDFSTFVNELLDAKTPEISENFTSLEDSLICLRKQLNMDDSKRLQIEPDYVFSDVLSYYKRVDFDPKIPLKLICKIQAPVDGGGVLRQFYSDGFSAVEECRERIPQLFESSANGLIPADNVSLAGCDLMETFGSILARAIIQAEIGISFLSPVIYEYLVSGEIGKLIPSIDDVIQNDAKECLIKVLISFLDISGKNLILIYAVSY